MKKKPTQIWIQIEPAVKRGETEQAKDADGNLLYDLWYRTRLFPKHGWKLATEAEIKDKLTEKQFMKWKSGRATEFELLYVAKDTNTIKKD